MIFVDTNYFLAWLLPERDEQHRQAKELFKAAAGGEKKLYSSAIVFFEIYWVLTSFYGKGKPEVVKILQDLLRLGFVKWENQLLLSAALEYFSRSNLDLEDSYNLALIRNKKIKMVKSFDKQFSRAVGS